MSDDWQEQLEYFPKLFFDQPDSVVNMNPFLVLPFRVGLRPALTKLTRDNLPGLARIDPVDAIDARWHSYWILALHIAQSPRCHLKAKCGGVLSPDNELVVNVAAVAVVGVV